MVSVNEEIDSDLIEKVFDNGTSSDMKDLEAAEHMLDGWLKSDKNQNNPNRGSIIIWLEEVKKLVDAKKNMSAGRRRRKSKKSRKSRKSRKVRKARKTRKN